MGKKKEKVFSEHMWHHQNPKKVAELSERYGVERPQFDEDHGYDYERYYDEVNRAAQTDYDQRRTLEAAGLAGNKKAAKMSAQGFRNTQDVYDAHKFSKKHHEKRGMGGKFSSASDYAGLTDYFVNKDRDALLESMPTPEDNKEDTPLDKARKSFGMSPKAAKASAYVDTYEDRADGLHKHTMTDNRFGDAETQDAAAQEFADAYKDKVKKRMSPEFTLEKTFT